MSVFGAEDCKRIIGEGPFRESELENPVEEFEFDSNGEVLAFLRGLDAAAGWLEYEVVTIDGDGLVSIRELE